MKNTLHLAAGQTVLAIGARAARAEVTVTETPDRMTVENESVRVVFDATLNFVPSELIDKRGSGQSLIVNSFCLYYQYIEGGSLRSVNEGCPGGQILEQAEEMAGKYLNAGDQYFFDGYAQDPTRLLALRHEIGKMVEELTRAARP